MTKPILISLLMVVVVAAPATRAADGRPALAIKFTIDGDQAKVIVALNFLTKPDEQPRFEGVRFYTYQVPLNADPKPIGWAPKPGAAPLAQPAAIVLQQKRYPFHLTDLDRHENGALRITKEAGAVDRYRLQGAYCYFSQVFVIDATVSAGDPILLSTEPPAP